MTAADPGDGVLSQIQRSPADDNGQKQKVTESNDAQRNKTNLEIVRCAMRIGLQCIKNEICSSPAAPKARSRVHPTLSRTP